MAVVAVIVVVVSFALAGDGPEGWEVSIGRWAYDLPDWTTPGLEAVMQAGTRIAPIVAAAVLAVIGWRWRALAVLGAGFLAWGVSRVAKELADRPRPTEASLGRPVREVVAGPGYPSTHAAVSAGLATAIVLLLRSDAGRARPLVAGAVLAVAAATSLARVHLGVHWTLDVVGGAGIGVLAGSIAVAVLGASRT